MKGVQAISANCDDVKYSGSGTPSKLIVSERPEEVVELVRAWRASIIEAGLPRIRRRSDVPLHVVRGEHVGYEERAR